MQERVTVLRHHLGLCLEPFLKDVSTRDVKETLSKEVFSRLEKFDIEGVPSYPFLSNKEQREKYLEAFTEAGIAFVTNNIDVIPDLDEKGKPNADIICRACGNFQENQCVASQDPEQ
jgi:hypothetical protein